MANSKYVRIVDNEVALNTPESESWMPFVRRLIQILFILVLISITVYFVWESGYDERGTMVSVGFIAGYVTCLMSLIYLSFTVYGMMRAEKVEIMLLRFKNLKIHLLLSALFFMLSLLLVFSTYQEIRNERNLLTILFVVLLSISLLYMSWNRDGSSDRMYDIGKVLAASYFYGFIRIALVSGTDASQPSIVSRMRDFAERQQRLNFLLEKLVILIPKSGIIEKKLTNFNEQDKDLVSLSENGVLDSYEIARAGVSNRVYRHTVSEIRDEGYVVMEFPTPIKTLREMVDHGGKRFRIDSEQFAIEQKHFVDQLQELLDENPEIGKYVEIIEFDDRTEQGSPVKLSEVFMERFKSLEGEQRLLIDYDPA